MGGHTGGLNVHLTCEELCKKKGKKRKNQQPLTIHHTGHHSLGFNQISIQSFSPQSSCASSLIFVAYPRARAAVVDSEMTSRKFIAGGHELFSFTSFLSTRPCSVSTSNSSSSSSSSASSTSPSTPCPRFDPSTNRATIVVRLNASRSARMFRLRGESSHPSKLPWPGALS